MYLEYDYPELAVQVLQTGAAINENSAEILNGLGVAYQNLKQYDRAIESLKKALDLDGSLYDAMYNLGMVYAAADKPKQAEQTLDHFTRVATGKKAVNEEYIRAAKDKIVELQGEAIQTGAEAAPPERLKE